MYVIIGSQFVSHEGKVLLISLGIVTITLYVIERQRNKMKKKEYRQI
jgi:hypothetical protein